MSVSGSAPEGAAPPPRSSRLAAGVGLMVFLGLSASAGLVLAQPGDRPAPSAKAPVPDAVPAGGPPTGFFAVHFADPPAKQPPAKPKARDKSKVVPKLVDDPLPEKPPEGWQEYVQEKYKAYSIWLPKSGRKLFQKDGVLDVDTMKVGYVVLRCEIDDDVTLNVQRLIIPLKKGETLDAVTMIETFRDVHLEEFEGTVTKEYDLMLGRMPGKEYRVDLKGGEKSRVRIYQIDRAVWRLWVTGTKEQVEGDTAKLIFASFKNQLLINEALKKKDPPAKKP
ncbi:hypothetical protein [Frigoriglobus tundricola]|uniref:Uncharacterized protein n=1 Tax=Frigoriglobus tundricola TaxID=2774151 RepID=A0A6M5YT12_9BACT|nr:hypothetical protein [Frigoriglobus tundricola]QJW96999.1 hypothetical protein FTUN_4559 [Frigoriglobus tundricola]